MAFVPLVPGDHPFVNVKSAGPTHAVGIALSALTFAAGAAVVAFVVREVKLPPRKLSWRPQRLGGYSAAVGLRPDAAALIRSSPAYVFMGVLSLLNFWVAFGGVFSTWARTQSLCAYVKLPTFAGSSYSTSCAWVQESLTDLAVCQWADSPSPCYLLDSLDGRHTYYYSVNAYYYNLPELDFRDRDATGAALTVLLCTTFVSLIGGIQALVLHAQVRRKIGSLAHGPGTKTPLCVAADTHTLCNSGASAKESAGCPDKCEPFAGSSGTACCCCCTRTRLSFANPASVFRMRAACFFLWWLGMTIGAGNIWRQNLTGMLRIGPGLWVSLYILCSHFLLLCISGWHWVRLARASSLHKGGAVMESSGLPVPAAGPQYAELDDLLLGRNPDVQATPVVSSVMRTAGASLAYAQYTPTPPYPVSYPPTPMHSHPHIMNPVYQQGMPMSVPVARAVEGLPVPSPNTQRHTPLPQPAEEDPFLPQKQHSMPTPATVPPGYTVLMLTGPDGRVGPVLVPQSWADSYGPGGTGMQYPSQQGPH